MTPGWLRMVLGLDVALQAGTPHGKVGVSISSRIASAVAHGHTWGYVGQWLLERSIPLRWIFGPGHCAGAVRHDIARALEAIDELSDPVVRAWACRDWRRP